MSQLSRGSSANNGMPSAQDWLTASISSIEDMENFLGGIVNRLSSKGYSERDVFSIRLALEEAIVNAIRHGHAGDTSKAVCVRHALNDRELIVEVQDQGPGFDPDQLPDPLAPENLDRPNGRGVFLMRHYMTSVKYNDRGNCVTLSKSKSE